MSELRPVPRNIDAANRTTEYVVGFLVGYYGTQFIFQNPILSFLVGAGMIYFIFKVTEGKPEGAFFRILYRFVAIGKFVPNPKKSPKFEI